MAASSKPTSRMAASSKANSRIVVAGNNATSRMVDISNNSNSNNNLAAACSSINLADLCNSNPAGITLSSKGFISNNKGRTTIGTDTEGRRINV